MSHFPNASTAATWEISGGAGNQGMGYVSRAAQLSMGASFGSVAANSHLIGINGTQAVWKAPSLWLKAEDATLDGATFVTVGASPQLSRVVNYADAATQGAFWSFSVPYDWTGGVITAQIYWTPGATDAVSHRVRWKMTAKSVVIGGDVTAAGTATTFSGAQAARTVNLYVQDTATSTGVTPTNPNSELFMLEIQRIGADAADTYVGAVRVHGVLITY